MASDAEESSPALYGRKEMIIKRQDLRVFAHRSGHPTHQARRKETAGPREGRTGRGQARRWEIRGTRRGPKLPFSARRDRCGCTMFGEPFWTRPTHVITLGPIRITSHRNELAHSSGDFVHPSAKRYYRPSYRTHVDLNAAYRVRRRRGRRTAHRPGRR